MKFLPISKLLLIAIFPFLIFLIGFNLAGFDSSFFKGKFSEYGISKKIPKAEFLHQSVMEFIKGSNDELPEQFNEREKEHLLDVKAIASVLMIILYSLAVLFLALLVASGFFLRINGSILNFTGKILVFGGILAILLGGILFVSIKSDFQTTFESFHKLFFEKDTYMFDPESEIIVNLYPEEIFMDLGARISQNVLAISLASIFLGLLLLPKSKKNKKKK